MALAGVTSETVEVAPEITAGVKESLAEAVV